MTNYCIGAKKIKQQLPLFKKGDKKKIYCYGKIRTVIIDSYYYSKYCNCPPPDNNKLFIYYLCKFATPFKCGPNDTIIKSIYLTENDLSNG